MSITTNARVAGFTYWIYIVAGIGAMAVASNAAATAVLSLVTSFSAVVLGVTLYAITRGEDPDLALIAMACRLIEAVPGRGEIYFAVASLMFCWLLLRGRMIPVALAWLGVVASVLLVVLLPMQIAGFFGGPRAWSSPVTWAAWLPMLVFELTFGTWMIIKGVVAPQPRPLA